LYFSPFPKKERRALPATKHRLSNKQGRRNHYSSGTGGTPQYGFYLLTKTATKKNPRPWKRRGHVVTLFNYSNNDVLHFKCTAKK
jgi:hypothetical protein